MDDRTYPDELARLRAEVKRLESELTLRLRQLMRANAEDRLWLMKTERLTHDLADAQTVANLQRDLHAAELDKPRRELTALRDERPRLLAANVRLFHDNNALRAELDAERNAHNATAAQLYAELDAMRQAHSVIVGRMEAMGC